MTDKTCETEMNCKKACGKKCTPVRVACILGLVLLIGSTSLLMAHERRLVGTYGQYTLVIGFRNEPAFQGEMNAIDIIVTRSSDQKPISTRAGDTVDLEVEVQTRAQEAFNAPVVRFAKIEKPQPTFDVPNRYNAWFRAAEEGTYAFHITGTLADATNTAAPALIDETFVCGKGTRAAQGAFNCVRAPQVFPDRGRGTDGK